MLFPEGHRTARRSLSVAVCCAALALLPARTTGQCREDFAGRWSTTYGELVLERSGDTVAGASTQGRRVSGTVKGKKLKGTWQQDDGATGWFEFQHEGIGLFTGSFGGGEKVGRYDTVIRGKGQSSRAWGGRCLSMSTPEGIAALAARLDSELAMKEMCRPRKLNRSEMARLGNSMIPPHGNAIAVEGVALQVGSRYRVEGSIMEARLEQSVLPDYQVEDFKNSAAGSAQVAILIGKNGQVKEVQRAGGDANSMTYARLEASIKQWRYRPSTYCGEPIEVVNTAVVSPREQSTGQIATLRAEIQREEDERRRVEEARRDEQIRLAEAKRQQAEHREQLAAARLAEELRLLQQAKDTLSERSWRAREEKPAATYRSGLACSSGALTWSAERPFGKAAKEATGKNDEIIILTYLNQPQISGAIRPTARLLDVALQTYFDKLRISVGHQMMCVQDEDGTPLHADAYEYAVQHSSLSRKPAEIGIFVQVYRRGALLVERGFGLEDISSVGSMKDVAIEQILLREFPEKTSIVNSLRALISQIEPAFHDLWYLELKLAEIFEESLDTRKARVNVNLNDYQLENYLELIKLLDERSTTDTDARGKRNNALDELRKLLAEQQGWRKVLDGVYRKQLSMLSSIDLPMGNEVVREIKEADIQALSALNQKALAPLLSSH